MSDLSTASQVPEASAISTRGSLRTRNLAQTRNLLTTSVDNAGGTNLPPAAGAAVSVVEQLRGLARLLSAKEVADILQIHVESVYLLMKRDGLPNVLVGRSRRIDSVLLAAWLEERSS